MGKSLEHGQRASTVRKQQVRMIVEESEFREAGRDGGEDSDEGI